MVTEEPTNDEIYGLDTEILLPDEFTPTLDGEIDEQLMLVAVLALLFNLYKEYEYKTPDYILSHLPDSIMELEKKTQALSQKELTLLAESHKTTTLEKVYGLAKQIHKKINLDYDIKPTLEVMKSSITGTLNQLRDDIITKAKAFKDIKQNNSEWSIKNNFKRAIRRTKNYVRFNSQTIKQKVTRSIQKMVYGADMKYYWRPSGRRTCAKCWAMARLPPQTIELWPLDHPNGACVLDPEGDSATAKYKSLLEESQKYAAVTPV